MGYKQSTNNDPVTREITGVSYRSVTSEGTTRLRGEIDLFLRAGDTCSYNGESFTVSEIAYIVNAISSYMEVAE